jgi:hypothetical protein
MGIHPPPHYSSGRRKFTRIKKEMKKNVGVREGGMKLSEVIF